MGSGPSYLDPQSGHDLKWVSSRHHEYLLRRRSKGGGQRGPLLLATRGPPDYFKGSCADSRLHLKPPSQIDLISEIACLRIGLSLLPDRRCDIWAANFKRTLF